MGWFSFKRKFLVSLALLSLTACTNTQQVETDAQTTFSFKVPEGYEIPKAPSLSFSIPSAEFPSPKVTRYLKNSYCGLSFTTQIQSIDQSIEDQAFAGALFQAEDSDKSLYLIMLVDRETREVLPVIAHSDDAGAAEPVAPAFPMHIPLFTSIYPVKDGLGILVSDEGLLNPAPGREIGEREFKVQIVNTGFSVGSVVFSGQGAVVDFTDIRFSEECADSPNY
ncbi:hypothetical protein [Parahaliea mediterranea]|uniref:Lipoprotein n=1 Tax=Parahaliea mediterranea TaxID=651086 RepID=A0A939DHH9_9GAMM|nr:hypothetical protein [Parahaliea mediterranea]MBN7798276.1 hypothetical protein [Parahaliea mediterranea]